MRGFILGIIVTIVAIFAAALLVAVTGRVTMRADILPPSMEKRMAMRAMDMNVERNAPKIADPVAPTEENLVAGAALYRDHCTLCHGDQARPVSPLARTLNPPPPQFMTEEPDMAENENFYITLHGVRWIGMPGWKNMMTRQQIWTVVTFLSRMGSLPPAAKAVFAPAPAKTAPRHPRPK